MFGNRHFDRVYQIFADQFAEDGAGFIYRKSMKGAPIHVTAEERDSFVAAFRRHMRYTFWGMVVGIVLVAGMLVVLESDDRAPLNMPTSYVGIGVVCAAYLAAYMWSWNAPARALEHRPLAGNALTRDEARMMALSRMTYRQLGFACVAALLLVWNVSARNDVLHGWGRLWLVFAAGIAVAAAVQAVRKWRMERSER